MQEICHTFWNIYNQNKSAQANRNGMISFCQSFVKDWTDLCRWIANNPNRDSFVDAFGDKYADFIISWMDTHTMMHVNTGVRIVKTEDNLKRIYNNCKHLYEVYNSGSLPEFKLK